MKSENKSPPLTLTSGAGKQYGFSMPLKVEVPPPIHSRHVETCQRETHSQVNPGFLEALA